MIKKYILLIIKILLLLHFIFDLFINTNKVSNFCNSKDLQFRETVIDRLWKECVTKTIPIKLS